MGVSFSNVQFICICVAPSVDPFLPATCRLLLNNTSRIKTTVMQTRKQKNEQHVTIKKHIIRKRQRNACLNEQVLRCFLKLMTDVAARDQGRAFYNLSSTDTARLSTGSSSLPGASVRIPGQE